MKYRRLGKTNLQVSEVSLGTWQVGGKWGQPFDDDNAYQIINKALDQGVNFIDTADVYEGGLSEKAIGRVKKERPNDFYIATKCGRYLSPHISEMYTPTALETFIDQSLIRLNTDCIDLVQLHCPPSQIYYRPEIFYALSKIKAKGKINNIGVSVEKVEEGLKAIEYDCVATVQLIFNLFRQRPMELFFDQAIKADIGIIARVPLASGLLTGLYNKTTVFGDSDHRTYNRNGEAFDKGETFSGIDFLKGLDTVEKIKQLFPLESNLIAMSLNWILTHSQISCVIPGASSARHLDSNLSYQNFTGFSDDQLSDLKSLYEKHIKLDIHHLW